MSVEFHLPKPGETYDAGDVKTFDVVDALGSFVIMPNGDKMPISRAKSERGLVEHQELAEEAPVTVYDVKLEEQRRKDTPFLHNGFYVDMAGESWENLKAARGDAQFALLSGVTDNSWLPTGWIGKPENGDPKTLVNFTPLEFIDMTNLMKIRFVNVIFGANRLQAMVPIPSDYATDESNWDGSKI